MGDDTISDTIPRSWTITNKDIVSQKNRNVISLFDNFIIINRIKIIVDLWNKRLTMLLFILRMNLNSLNGFLVAQSQGSFLKSFFMPISMGGIMESKGYVYAYRGAWNHPAFNNLREAAIWNFLYQNAFWEDGERNFNGYTFNLKRGQIVISISFLAKGFGMTDKGVRVVIQKLEKLGMLGIQGASRGTIITICNYDKFQQKEKTEGENKGNRRASRGRAEGENNKEIINKRNNEDIYKPENVSDGVWDDFVKLRKAKKSPITETVMKEIKKESEKIGWTLEQTLTEMCSRGWVGFKAEWINNKGKQNGKESYNDRIKRETTELMEQFSN